MIPALVLTAGLATRLRPLSFVRAKAAMPVAGQPIIRRILQYLRSSGVGDAVLNLHHLPHTITQIVGDGSDLDMRVRYSWEVPVLGSAGGPRQALPILEARTFLVVNGDTLTNVDIPALIESHRKSKALVTMAVIRNDDPDKYGGVLVSTDGAVTGFTGRGTGQPAYHFVGLQVAQADAFEPIPPGSAAESVGSVYPALINARPGSVRAHVASADFVDIGTPQDYLRTSLVMARRETNAVLADARTRIHPAAHVEDSVVWDDVEIGAGAIVRRCIVTDGVHVAAGASWNGVTLRQAGGALAPGEARVRDLAVGRID